MGLLDGDLAATIGRALDFMLLDITIRRDGAASVNSYGDDVPGTAVTYAARGFEDEYTSAYRAVAGIPSTDTRIMVAANSTTATPKPDDLILYRSQWHRVRAVRTDPARAMWDLQVFVVPAP